MKGFVRGAAVAALAVVALAGCGSSKKVIDQAKVQDETTKILTDAGVETTSVSCPKDVEIKSGGTFDCTATSKDGTSFPMIVTMTSNDGDVNIESSGDVVLMTSQVMQQAADKIAKDAGQDVNLKCPPVEKLTNGTGSVTCDATGSTGASGSVTLGFSSGKLTSAEIN